MLLSLVKNLLNNTVSIDDFRDETAVEIAEYQKVYALKNVTIPVHLKEDIYYLFTNTEFDALQEMLSSRKLTDYEVSYICDALSLSEMTTYDNDSLAEKVESLVTHNY